MDTIASYKGVVMKYQIFSIIVAIIMGLSGMPVGAQSSMNGANDIDNQPFTFTTFRDIAKQYSDSVVNISTTTVVKPSGMLQPRNRTPFDEFFGDDFFRYFSEPQTRPRTLQSLGSGVIIDTDGYILTNNHVVKDVDEVTVTLLNGDTYQATVIGTDSETDIGLIKIDPKSAVNPIPMGDSDIIIAGDWVMAIGNPFGFGHTVTVGVVSATRRSTVMPRDELPYQDFIQTDASINPGNSGGPLLDIHGRLIGINTVIASRTGQSAGIGFAIPINMVKPLLKDLKEKGSVTRGWLGVTIQSITPDLAEGLNLSSTEGAIIAEVVGDGPAAEAGIEAGDVILEFDGMKIRDSGHLSQVVASTPVDKKVKLEFLRNGKKKSADIKIGLRPGSDLQLHNTSGVSLDFGMTVQNISPEIARQLRLDSTAGVLISDVEAGGAAEKAGLTRGDIILELNRKPLKNVEDYKDAVSDLKSDEGVVLYVQRGKSRIFIGLRPASK
ncbi:Do family serine endopeptidase [bacterium]|nr:Do family serine endopeptidase [candidate division CSSED10-310 bacterium]